MKGEVFILQCTHQNKLDSSLFVVLKVHGGTTEADILKSVKEAEEIAHSNKNDYHVDTVLLFDEANTTEAIGLIKEVMCDNRICGREIKADVKFIATCNPYRR